MTLFVGFMMGLVGGSLGIRWGVLMKGWIWETFGRWSVEGFIWGPLEGFIKELVGGSWELCW